MYKNTLGQICATRDLEFMIVNNYIISYGKFRGCDISVNTL